MMVSIVEGDDTGPAGAESTGFAVSFMVGDCVRLNKGSGYRKRAHYRNWSKIGGVRVDGEVPVVSPGECTDR
jgi:hypothetical protein